MQNEKLFNVKAFRYLAAPLAAWVQILLGSIVKSLLVFLSKITGFFGLMKFPATPRIDRLDINGKNLTEV